jgi:hypothetical protein
MDNRLNTLIRELAAFNVDGEIVEAAVNTPDIARIQALMMAYQQKIGDPFLEDELLEAIFEHAVSNSQHDTFAVIAHLLSYNSLSARRYMEWLCEADLARAMPILRECVKEHQSTAAAEAIIHAFYQLDYETALLDASPLVAAAAAHKIVSSLTKKYEQPAIMNALQAHHPIVRAAAAWHIGQKRDLSMVEWLINALSVETDHETQRAMIWALGVLRDPRAVTIIRSFLLHQDALIIQTAEEALKRL